MKVLRRTRILLGCLAEVMRRRRCVAAALRKLRRSSGPRLHLLALRRCERWLAASMRTLELAWDCCVRSEEGLT